MLMGILINRNWIIYCSFWNERYRLSSILLLSLPKLGFETTSSIISTNTPASAASFFQGQPGECIIYGLAYSSKVCVNAVNVTLEYKQKLMKEKKVCKFGLSEGHVGNKCIICGWCELWKKVIVWYNSSKHFIIKNNIVKDNVSPFMKRSMFKRSIAEDCCSLDSFGK